MTRKRKTLLTHVAETIGATAGIIVVEAGKVVRPLIRESVIERRPRAASKSRITKRHARRRQPKRRRGAH